MFITDLIEAFESNVSIDWKKNSQMIEGFFSFEDKNFLIELEIGKFKKYSFRVLSIVRSANGYSPAYSECKKRPDVSTMGVNYIISNGENSVGLGDMLDNAVSDQYGKYKTREGFYQKKQL